MSFFSNWRRVSEVHFFLMPPAFLPGAAVCALVGLYAYEHCFVMAPQEVPNA